MNIGGAVRKSGLPAKAIRCHEDIGLLQPDHRENGYRDDGVNDVHRLTLLKCARGLGFSIEDCRRLIALCSGRTGASHDVREIAVANVRMIESKIAGEAH